MTAPLDQGPGDPRRAGRTRGIAPATLFVVVVTGLVTGFALLVAIWMYWLSGLMVS